MVVPILLLGLFRFPRFRHRGALLNVFLAGFLISLGLSCYDLISHPNAAFYLLPSRAWELLTGCFLAILPPEWMPVRRPVRELASLAGLAGILIPCFFYGNNTPFPGIAALPPCLGTALIIWSTSSCEASQPVLGRVLATRPLVFVGLISYSLYLWHWPLLAFGRYSSFEPLSWELRIGLLALAIVLSVLSWRFVETPFRKRGLCATRRSIFVFEASGAHLIDPRPRFLDSEQAHYVISAEGAALYTDATHLSIKGAMLMLLPLLRDSFNPVSATSKIQTPEEPADSHGDDTGPT